MRHKKRFQVNTSVHDILGAYKQEVVFRTDRLLAPLGAPQLSNRLFTIPFVDGICRESN